MMKFQDGNLRVTCLAASTGTIASLLVCAFMMTIPVYSQSSSDKAWEVLKAGGTTRLSAASRSLSSLIGTFVTVESRGKRHRGRVLDVDVDEGLVLQLGGGPAKPFPPGETTIVQ